MSNARNLANLLGTGTTIASAKIADDAITNAKILNDAVTGAKIEDNPTIAGNLIIAGTTTAQGETIGFVSFDKVKLNATDGSATDAGDNLILNGTDATSANADSSILFEGAESDAAAFLSSDQIRIGHATSLISLGNIMHDGALKQGAILPSNTGGSAFDFTGFPVNTSVIYVVMDEQDWSGQAWTVIQLGTVNGLQTTGYDSAVAYPGSGNSYYANSAADNNGIKYVYVASTEHAAICEIWRANHSGTRWVGKTLSHTQEDNSSYSCHSLCDVQLDGAEPLDRIRIINTAGTPKTSSGKGNMTVYFM